MTTTIKEKRRKFKETLKDPYFGRPVIIRNAVVGSQFMLAAEKTGEFINFVCADRDRWIVYGNERNSKIYSLKQVEDILAEFWQLAGEDNKIDIADPSGMTFITNLHG